MRAAMHFTESFKMASEVIASIRRLRQFPDEPATPPTSSSPAATTPVTSSPSVSTPRSRVDVTGPFFVLYRNSDLTLAQYLTAIDLVVLKLFERKDFLVALIRSIWSTSDNAKVPSFAFLAMVSP